MVGEEQLKLSVHHDGKFPAQGDEPAVIMKHRRLIPDLLFCIDHRVIAVDFEPGGSRREPGLRRFIPLHGTAGIVPAFAPDRLHHMVRCEDPACLHQIPPGVEGFQIPQLIEALDVQIRHPQLFALVDVGSAFHEVDDIGQHFCRLDPIGAIVAET